MVYIGDKSIVNSYIGNATSPGLRIGAIIALLQSVSRLLVKKIISTEYTTPNSITLVATNTTNYQIINKPSWCSINSSTGEVTVTPDGTLYGIQKFDVLLDNETTITDGLVIVLTEPQDTNLLPKLYKKQVSTSILDMTLNSINSSGGIPISNGNGGWNYLCAFYQSYPINHQLILIDGDSTSPTFGQVILSKTPPYYEGEPWNQFVSITDNNGYTFVSSSSYLFRYDYVAKTFDMVLTFPANGTLYTRMNISTNGLITVPRTDGDGKVNHMEIDSTTFQIINNYIFEAPALGLRTGTLSDATYVYLPSADISDFSFVSKNRSTGVETVLIKPTEGVEPTQTKYGAIIRVKGDTIGTTYQLYVTDTWVEQTVVGGIPDGWYFVYDGKLYLAGDYNTREIVNNGTEPWPNQPAGLSIRDSVYTTNSPNQDYAVDYSKLVPGFGTTTGYIWRKETNVSPWTRLDVPNIITYPINFKNIRAVGDKVLGIGADYAGYTIYDTNTQQLESKKFSSISVSTYCYAEIGNKFYISGYPSGPLFEYDSTQPWDNTIGENPSLNPDETPVTSNPRFIGYTRYSQTEDTSPIDSGQHKNLVMVASDGDIWVAGEWIRDGVGTGITRVKMSTDETMVGFRDATLENFYVRSGCATTDYIVFFGQTLDNDTPTLLTINKATHAFSYKDMSPYDNQYTSILHTYDNNIMITSTDDSTTLSIIGVDVSNLLAPYLYVNKNTNLPYIGSPTNGIFEKRSDGQIYGSFYTPENQFIVPIDMNTGNIIRGVGTDIANGSGMVESNSLLYILDNSNKQVLTLNDYLTPQTFSLTEIIHTFAGVNDFETRFSEAGSTWTNISEDAVNRTAEYQYNIPEASASTAAPRFGVWLDLDGYTPVGYETWEINYTIDSISGNDIKVSTVNIGGTATVNHTIPSGTSSTNTIIFNATTFLPYHSVSGDRIEFFLDTSTGPFDVATNFRITINSVTVTEP